MQLQLGATNAVLEDGFATWDATAADALALWNVPMDAFQFASLPEAATSKASDDGYNSVFFSSSVFGESFGDGVLAVTILLYDVNGFFVSREADVVVNQSYNYNSYRGPLKAGAPDSRVYDIHRILLHEFGHVLGLAHPDTAGRNVVAIMNSVIGNLATLATDDIDGAIDLYGLRITSPGEFDAQVGKTSTFKVTTNAEVSSFSATGLPAGLTINSATGVISGKVNVTGGFTAQVTAHGKKDVAAPLFIYVTSATAVGDLRQLWGLKVNRLITDPLRNRVYASLSEAKSVAVIDAATLTLLKAIPVASEPDGMAISLDGNTIFVAEKGTDNPVIGVIDLQTLAALPSLPAPFATADVATGLENRLFVTAWNRRLTNIEQIDSSTGKLLAAFPSALPNGLLQVSPDRKTLYLAASDVTPSTLYKFDVSSETPVKTGETPRDRISGLLEDFKLSHDASILCAADGGAFTLLRIPAANLSTTDGGYLLPHAGLTRGAIAFSNDDQTMLVTNQSDVAQGIDLFDVATQTYQRTILTDYFTPRSMAIDTLGQYVFVGSPEMAELRVYALGSKGLSGHQPLAKSLLNVSTRLNTQPGVQALIAGFIITGDAPKNVLVRGLGPSLPVEGALYDPELFLYDAGGKLIASCLYWGNSNKTPILLTGLAPAEDNETALYVTLFPGSYTVKLTDIGEISGVGLVEVYDLSGDADSKIANISTRGEVGTGDNVMVGGFIVSEDEPTKVLIRAIGPSLADAGVTGALQNPTLELHSANGDLIASNDDWRTTQKADILATTIPPTDDRESAIVATLPPAAYTAVVRGKNNTSGVALVEIYNLDSTAADE